MIITKTIRTLFVPSNQSQNIITKAKMAIDSSTTPLKNRLEPIQGPRSHNKYRTRRTQTLIKSKGFLTRFLSTNKPSVSLSTIVTCYKKYFEDLTRQ